MSVTGFQRMRREKAQQAAKTPDPAPVVATTPQAPKRTRRRKPKEPTTSEE